MADRLDEVTRLARERLGFAALRPGQGEAAASVLAGRDTLVVLPTGGGKSAIYQIAALLVPGPTLVVSPLIALQRDQMENAQAVAPAAALNSTLAAAERRDVLDDLASGATEFVFLAPEQFNREETFERLRARPPLLFVVDEAHCISEWGHDFRPEYMRLGAVVEALGHPVVLALTATASPEVRDEIVARLGMRDPAVIVRGFDRPNLFLDVQVLETEADKDAAFEGALETLETPAIVYVATRRHCEALVSDVARHGWRTVCYHGGLKKAEREAAQQAFMGGEVDVIVATSAFGMGVDKADVRTVLHYDVPGSPDAYYQEVGRAGRDGAPAKALLLYRRADLGLHKFFAAGGRVDADDVERVAEAVHASEAPVHPRDLAKRTDLSAAKVARALGRLADAGAVTLTPTGEAEGADAEAVPGEDEREARERRRIEHMRAYAEAFDCRRVLLLRYFGESPDAVPYPCGRCDNCASGNPAEIRRMEREARRAPAPAAAPEAQAPPFAVASRVRHAAWGLGTVLRYEGERVVVGFDDEGVGEKLLALGVVVERGLLAPA